MKPLKLSCLGKFKTTQGEPVTLEGNYPNSFVFATEDGTVIVTDKNGVPEDKARWGSLRVEDYRSFTPELDFKRPLVYGGKHPVKFLTEHGADPEYPFLVLPSDEHGGTWAFDRWGHSRSLPQLLTNPPETLSREVVLSFTRAGVGVHQDLASARAAPGVLACRTVIFKLEVGEGLA